jgi:hypothetical protein
MCLFIWPAAKAAIIGANGVAKAVVAMKAAAAAHPAAAHSSVFALHYDAGSVLSAYAVVPGVHAAIIPGAQVAGGSPAAVAFLHAAESQAAHLANSPAVSHLAKQAGNLAANSLASKGSQALGTASVRAIRCISLLTAC